MTHEGRLGTWTASRFYSRGRDAAIRCCSYSKTWRRGSATAGASTVCSCCSGSWSRSQSSYGRTSTSRKNGTNNRGSSNRYERSTATSGHGSLNGTTPASPKAARSRRKGIASSAIISRTNRGSNHNETRGRTTVDTLVIRGGGPTESSSLLGTATRSRTRATGSRGSSGKTHVITDEPYAEGNADSSVTRGGSRVCFSGSETRDNNRSKNGGGQTRTGPADGGRSSESRSGRSTTRNPVVGTTNLSSATTDKNDPASAPTTEPATLRRPVCLRNRTRYTTLEARRSEGDGHVMTNRTGTKAGPGATAGATR